MELRIYFGIVYVFLGLIILIFLINHTRIRDLFLSESGRLLSNGGCVYINLENREDRKKNILKVMDSLEIPTEKINKVSGVYIPKNGHKGCVQAHILALQIAKMNKWDHILILEDDAKLNCNENEIQSKLKLVNDFITSNKWDIFMLSAAFKKSSETDHDNIVKIQSASTSTAYIVNNTYYDTLLKTFINCNNNMLSSRWEKDGWESFALDQQWKPLQKEHLWFALNEDLLKQDFSGSTIMQHTSR
tara:strand:+ start:34526 stop:35263 length:738 start_codon:yes stop_codon:yes gene_type:complete